MCLQGAVGLASMILVTFAIVDLNAYLSALELHLWKARAKQTSCCNRLGIGMLQVECSYNCAMEYCCGILQWNIARVCLLKCWSRCLQGAS